MAKTRQQKEQTLELLKEKFSQSKGVVLADYTGLKVVDAEVLRNQCKAEGVELIAVKKTIIKKILQDLKMSDVENVDFSGSLAVAFSADEVLSAKILNDFAKKHEQVQLRAGIIDGNLMGLSQVKALAMLPSKQELYAKVVGSLQAPISGFVNVLAGNLRGLVQVLNAIKNNK